jgi:hypothetical protein
MVIDKTMMMVAVALSCTACFDPQLPSECPGRVCGTVDQGGFGGDGGAGGAVAMGGNPGGMGGMGGSVGGNGGAGGDTLFIEITAPADNSAINHGTTLWFEALVTTNGAQPPNDTLIWESSQFQEVFGIGYAFQRTLNVQGPHTITVTVMQGDNPIASDSINVDAL